MVPNRGGSPGSADRTAQPNEKPPPNCARRMLQRPRNPLAAEVYNTRREGSEIDKTGEVVLINPRIVSRLAPFWTSFARSKGPLDWLGGFSSPGVSKDGGGELRALL